MRERERWADAGSADDVERLLVRLEPVAPPPTLQTRILAQTTQQARVRWGVWVGLAVIAGVLATGLAAVSGYLTGQEFVQSGAYALIGLALQDWELVTAAPQEYALAVAEAVPWGGLLATLACVVAAYAATRPLARAAELLAATAAQPA
jgi:hypothetical protein